MRIRRYCAILALMFGLLQTSCDGSREFQSIEGQKRRKQSDDKDKPEKSDDSKAKEEDEEETDGELPASDSGVEGGEGEASGEDELDSFESGGDGQAAIDAILEECGGREALDAAPDQIIVQKSLSSLPITTKVFTITVRATTALQVAVSPKETIQESTVRIDSVTGLFSTFARGRADDQAKENSGKVTIDNVLPGDIGTVGDKHKTWEGTRCTFVPATRLVNGRGGKRTVVSFDPPMPMTLSPKAVAKRYEEEIGDERIFDGLTVKVEETNQDALKGKTSVTGRVTVTRIPASTSVDDGNGGKVAINADIAYRVRSEFDTPETTVLLGLQPEVSYYISHERKDVVANIVDTKAENAAPAIFIHPVAPPKP